MVRSRIEVFKAMLTEDAKASLKIVDEFLAEYTSPEALDGEGMDHEIYIGTEIILSADDADLVTEIIKDAGWKNVRVYNGCIRFYV